jgi:hypothetical protein
MIRKAFFLQNFASHHEKNRANTRNLYSLAPLLHYWLSWVYLIKGKTFAQSRLPSNFGKLTQYHLDGHLSAVLFSLSCSKKRSLNHLAGSVLYGRRRTTKTTMFESDIKINSWNYLHVLTPVSIIPMAIRVCVRSQRLERLSTTKSPRTGLKNAKLNLNKTIYLVQNKEWEKNIMTTAQCVCQASE